MQCDVVFTIVTTSTFMFSTPMWFVMEEEVALGFFIRILKRRAAHIVCSDLKVTKVNSKKILMKSSKSDFIFFPCLLPSYVPHENSKEFLKNSNF